MHYFFFKNTLLVRWKHVYKKKIKYYALLETCNILFSLKGGKRIELLGRNTSGKKCVQKLRQLRTFYTYCPPLIYMHYIYIYISVIYRYKIHINRDINIKNNCIMYFWSFYSLFSVLGEFVHRGSYSLLIRRLTI